MPRAIIHVRYMQKVYVLLCSHLFDWNELVHMFTKKNPPYLLLSTFTNLGFINNKI
jgi:hypothetical protein